ncbi:hypothetical protein [Undibacterium squillarum]|uniref:DUF3465 domain-containing protein n=1 Tax=Undibacterium squillarum TaxID=1131567 RepID=A0ABQ2Y2P6_9BURK|nr:hypothetical protein [Undibacterium squillarum]GGX53868.1 hypothetical protein GCM10010946_35670 [Undibacterium squillarum]
MQKALMLLAGWLLSATMAHADDNKAQCDLGKGSYMTATVIKGPKFTSGKFLKGVELSHTHLKVKPDGSNDIYDVAIDNVFAQGYEKNSKQVPESLAQIRTGDKLALCGQLYDDGSKGIHWVHTNCGATPTPQKPNGFIKIIESDGSSDNFENVTTYCDLWGKQRKR